MMGSRAPLAALNIMCILKLLLGPVAQLVKQRTLIRLRLVAMFCDYSRW